MNGQTRKEKRKSAEQQIREVEKQLPKSKRRKEVLPDPKSKFA